MKEPYTPEEKKVSNLLVDAHNMFIELEETHPSEKLEWLTHIHGLQNILSMRILRRDYPQTFPTIK